MKLFTNPSLGLKKPPIFSCCCFILKYKLCKLIIQFELRKWNIINPPCPFLWDLRWKKLRMGWESLAFATVIRFRYCSDLWALEGNALRKQFLDWNSVLAKFYSRIKKLLSHFVLEFKVKLHFNQSLSCLNSIQSEDDPISQWSGEKVKDFYSGLFAWWFQGNGRIFAEMIKSLVDMLPPLCASPQPIRSYKFYVTLLPGFVDFGRAQPGSHKVCCVTMNPKSSWYVKIIHEL